MTDYLKCPFCGATPHRGLTKVKYDQLHGEPYQDFEVWCPHGCARKLAPDEEMAIKAWNTRVAVPSQEPKP